MLVGKGRRVAFAIPMRNAAADPRRCYRFDDAEHIGIRQWLRRGAPALRIVGVYHSHPRSAAWPSPTDRAEANYPEWLYVIAGRTRVRFAVRGFRIRSRAAQEVSLRPDPERPRPTR